MLEMIIINDSPGDSKALLKSNYQKSRIGHAEK